MADERVVRILRELIAIPSENPGGDEEAIACYTERFLKRRGLRVARYCFAARRPNVVALLPGSDPSHTLLLTPHLDTVPAGQSWRGPPFKATQRFGRLYGLGATDCKCNLAVSLAVIERLVEEKVRLGYNLCLAATADEEAGSVFGLIPLLKKKILRPSAALVLDADDFGIVVAQKGLIHLKVKLRGVKAHGAYPWQGDNAIHYALAILKDVRGFSFRKRSAPYLKPPTVNIGTIRGGDAVNVVADWCEFELDFRFLPGDSAPAILKDLGALIRRYTRRFTIEVEGVQQPYRIASTHPLVRTLILAMRQGGVPVRVQGSEGATTITFFQEQGIPAVATGFGTEGCAHTADEYVRTANLAKGVRVMEGFLKRWKP